MIDKLRKYIVGTLPYVISALLFAAILTVGYFIGGSGFVTAWGGSIAAVWATVYLIYKSQMYWIWTIAYSILWGVLFFQQNLNVLGAYQFITIALCISGMVQWYLVKRGIGVNWARLSDRWVTAFTTIAVLIAIWAYWPAALTIWWVCEISSVLLAVVAIWMDAFRYKGNWWMWTLSNVFFLPLTIQGHLWGPFIATFVYSTLNFIGFFHWWKEEKAGVEYIEHETPVIGPLREPCPWCECPGEKFDGHVCEEYNKAHAGVYALLTYRVLALKAKLRASA